METQPTIPQQPLQPTTPTAPVVPPISQPASDLNQIDSEPVTSTEPVERVEEQSIITPTEPPKSKKSPLIPILIILLILALSATIYFFLQSRIVTPAPITSEGPTPVSTTNIDPTADWETYTDNESGFSLTYPKDILLNQESKGISTSALKVTVTKIDDIQDSPFNFSKETALKDQQSLLQGKYGEHIDWPTSDSEKVISLDGISAKTYTTFAVLEVCDIRFVRTAIVYNQDSQIIISYIGPNTLKQNIPDYLISDSVNCGVGGQVWKQDTNLDLYKALLEGSAPSLIQKWYDTFDQILSTFRFTNQTITNNNEKDALQSLVKEGVFANGKSHGLTSKDQIIVKVSKVENNYATGTTSFTPDVEGSGNVWFATMIDGNWTVVEETQEPPSCAIMEQYLFPQTIFSECINK